MKRDLCYEEVLMLQRDNYVTVNNKSPKRSRYEADNKAKVDIMKIPQIILLGFFVESLLKVY